MNYKKIIFAIALLGLTFISCQKEYSFENPLSGSSGLIIGNNCIIKKVIEFDTISNKGAAAINYNFNAAGDRILTINEIDSITLSPLFNANPNYVQDSIIIDPQQYFVVSPSNKRIIKFEGYQDPYDITSPINIYEYTYDAAGKLLGKTLKNAGLPGIVIEQTDYTYTNNNLTGIVKKIPLLNNTVLTASLEYDLAKQPKNYFNILPDCDELSPYIAVLNMGNKATNAVTKIIIKNYDLLTGTFIDSTVTQYSSYQYSLDNYVLSVDAAGYDIPAVPLVRGRNKFEYFCK
jgi:hypothetical protein